MRGIALFAVLLLTDAAALAAQEQPDPAPPQAPQESEALQALRPLLERIEERRRELARQTEASAERREELAQEIGTLERDFAAIATGVDRAQLEGSSMHTTLAAEIEDLLRPLLEELKSATEEPRELERLRSEVALYERRAQLADAAILNVERLERIAVDDELRGELADVQLEWQGIRADAVKGRAVAQAQLDQRERNRKPLVESASGFVANFFRSKGLNLLLAVLAFAAVFLGLRFTAERLLRAVTPRRAEGQRFYVRLLRVLSQVMIVVAAMLTALMVLYAAGDWVLLGLALLFLLGLAWAAKNTAPRFLDEMRLLLNLGPVREGERVVFEGLPWRVDRLTLYTTLSNPALSGGEIRLPLRALAGLHSRRWDASEPWFPCAEGDWVLLSDGTRGKVVTQTPEMTQLVRLGGARVTYQTADFLAQSPQNISAGFRLAEVFGVDYQHQSLATTDIPQAMLARLQPELEKAAGEDNLVNLAVEFRQAGASSLDYEVLADFNGEVAQRHERLRRTIQRVLVDACNENDWVIPFTQVTLHQAPAS